MVIAIYLVVLIINLIYSTRRKNNKFILWSTLIVIGIIFSGDINNTDMIYYSQYYYNALTRGFKGTEIGFNTLIRICYHLDLGLIGMRAIIYIVSTALINTTIKKICKNIHLYYGIYISFLFFIDTIQLRNFMAMAIFIYAFPYLCKGHNYILKYIILILFATTFHSTAIFYLLFLFVKIRNKKVVTQLLVITIYLFEIIVIFNKGRIPFIKRFSDFLIVNDKARLGQYLTTYTKTGSVEVVFLIIFSIILVYYSKKILKKSLEKNSEIILFTDTILYCVIFQLILVPFLWLNVEFYRMPRNILPLIYCIVINALFSIKKFTNQKITLLLLLIINITSWTIIAYGKISGWSYIYEPIFYNNAFFK